MNKIIRYPKISESKKGIKNPNYGKTMSKEQREGLSEILKKKFISEEIRKKRSEAIMGSKNPNYGKPLSEKHKRNLSDSKKGKRLSEITKKKMSESRKGKHPSKETREKLSKAKSKMKVRFNCKLCGKEKYIIPSLIKIGGGKFCSKRCHGIYTIRYAKQKDTDIELLIEKELIKRDVAYTKQVPLLGITLVDFLLPKDKVIYCDGIYWHSLAKVKEKDINQDFMLTFYGYKVFRFTDKEIKASPKKCIDIVLKESTK